MTNGQASTRRAEKFAKRLIILACCAVYWISEAKAAPTVISETGVVDPRSNEIMSEDAISNEILGPWTLLEITATSNNNVESARPITLPKSLIDDTMESRTGGYRTKRYLLHRTKWAKKNLTYNITKYSSTLPKEDVDREISRAFALWSNYTDLKFSQDSKKVDIEIRFERGDHGDSKPFDRTDNQLAHSFFPSSRATGGDVHFDDGQSWSINSYLGINLFQIAVHEFGHSLGLDHSSIKNSVMAPRAANYDPNFTLHRDDITGIQALYGSRTEKISKSPGNLDSNAIDPLQQTLVK